MKTAIIGLVWVAFAAVGCESTNKRMTPASSSTRLAEQQSIEDTTPETTKVGVVGHGLLATHYDRDANGIFEEVRRATTIFYDRNGDRMADLVVEGTPPFRRLEWDQDFDGILDHAVTSKEGEVHRWTNRREISRPAPGVFQQDRIERTTTCDLGEPGFRFWETLLGLDAHSTMGRQAPASSTRSRLAGSHSRKVPGNRAWSS